MRHPELAWARGTVSSSDSKSVSVKLVQGGSMKVEWDDVELCTTTDDQVAKVEDLTKLPDLHHPALLNSINERFKKDKIYTNTGQILIALNPFKKLGKLYKDDNMKKYLSAPPGGRGELSPHAWNLAHNAYESMCQQNGRNQSILVSGESGAGKTVSTKIVMEYFTIVASGNYQQALNERNQRGSAKRRSSSRDVSDRVLEANPLMEAFGNAKTSRNDNSSRFGKLIQLQFDMARCSLTGAFIDIYLLEKSRVIGQLSGERNYHIFYEMDKGLSSEQKKKIDFPNLKDCRYTGSSGCFKRNDVGDKEQFKDTLGAFQMLGFTDEEQDSVFRLVSAILHLGNVEFDEVYQEAEESSKVSKKTRSSLKTCASLLDIDSDMLEKTLCSRALNVGGGGMMGMLSKFTAGGDAGITKNHTASQAGEMRDGLAQTLYNQMFSWLVFRINQSTSGKESSGPASRMRAMKTGGTGKKGQEREYYSDYSIGCLDIFGFEVFQRNGFEQLLINYTNECLQNQFNDYVFHVERAVYESEGINWKVIEFPDNQPCLDMIEGRPIGLLALIDEECLYPNGSDHSLTQKLYTNLGKRFSKYFLVDREKRNNHEFGVRHFAKDVTYETEQFCTKNKNELRQESVDLLRTSKVKLFAMLLPPDAASAGGGSDPMKYFVDHYAKGKGVKRSSLERHKRPVSRGAARLQSQTVSASFKGQLKFALEHIRHSEPHYIRCIKSNDENVSNNFDRLRVEEQLCYSGVLEVVKVARAGYGSRFLIDDFLKRYGFLGASSSSRKRRSVVHDPKKVLKNSQLVELDDYQIGRTKVFLKAHAYNKLEHLRGIALRAHVIVLQRAVRAWLVRWRKDQAKREKAREKERKRKSLERREKLKREQEAAEAERKRLSAERRKKEQAEREKLERERVEAEERLAALRAEREREEKAAKERRARELREARVRERQRQKEEKARRIQEKKDRQERERLEQEAREAELALRREESNIDELRKRNSALRRQNTSTRDRLRSGRMNRESELLLLQEKAELLKKKEKERRQHEDLLEAQRQEEEERARLEQEAIELEEIHQMKLREEKELARIAALKRQQEELEIQAKNEKLKRDMEAKKWVERLKREKAEEEMAQRRVEKKKKNLERMAKSSARQRVAMTLQGVAKAIEERNTLENESAERAAESAVRALQKFSRNIALHKTEEMRLQEEEERYAGDGGGDMTIPMFLFGIAMIVVWYPTIAIAAAAALFAAAPHFEGRARRAQYDDDDDDDDDDDAYSMARSTTASSLARSTTASSFKAGRSKRKKPSKSPSSKTMSKSPSRAASRVADMDDLQFFEQHSKSSSKLSKVASRKKSSASPGRKLKKKGSRHYSDY